MYGTRFDISHKCMIRYDIQLDTLYQIDFAITLSVPIINMELKTHLNLYPYLMLWLNDNVNLQ